LVFQIATAIVFLAFFMLWEQAARTAPIPTSTCPNGIQADARWYAVIETCARENFAAFFAQNAGFFMLL